MRRWVWALGLGLAGWCGTGLRVAAQEEAPTVREIEVRFVGPETVNRAIVLANIQTATGKPLSREMIEQDVRNLINTGYFFDVRVLEESLPANSVKVIYQVQGKAVIREIVFEGEQAFKEARLRRDLTFKVGDRFDERKAHVDAQKLVDAYQKAGYPDAKIDPQASIDRDTGKAIVRFKVYEGPRVFVQSINWQGNKAFPASRLNKLMKTRRRWWGSWFSGTGVMKEDQFKEDQESLREFYRSHGYLDMDIKSINIVRISDHWEVVRIEVFEGPQYKVGTVSLEGTRLFPTVELEKQLKMTTGHTFTPGGLQADVKALEDYYGGRGYLDTNVRTTRSPNVETGRIDVRYTVLEGLLSYIQKIDIRGNTKTKDKVIRRELAVVPGQIYDTVRVDRSAERLRNLGYFSKVETTPEPTAVPNRKDLAISVVEQRTGSVTFGAGFSSVDSLLGFVEVTQGNFDLFNWPNFTGGGQKLRIRAQVGFKRQDYVLSFTEPWFLDQKLAFGFDAFHHSSSYLSSKYTEQRTGIDLRLEKALSEFVRGQVQYSIQDISVNVDHKASEELKSQDGSQLRSAIEAQLTYDTRDSVFLTTRGMRSEVSAEVAGGPLGGDVKLYKLNAKSSVYFPFFNKHVLQFMGAVGVVDTFGSASGPEAHVVETPTLQVARVDNVPIFDRYFLGGPTNLRGFGFQKVSPKDIQGESMGGNTYANGTAEYSFPIIERVRGALFFDAGNVWPNSYQFGLPDLKADVGIGGRLNLPIGPLRLDYGYPIMTDSESGHSGKIQFSVGYQF